MKESLRFPIKGTFDAGILSWVCLGESLRMWRLPFNYRRKYSLGFLFHLCVRHKKVFGLQFTFEVMKKFEDNFLLLLKFERKILKLEKVTMSFNDPSGDLHLLKFSFPILFKILFVFHYCRLQNLSQSFFNKKTFCKIALP